MADPCNPEYAQLVNFSEALRNTLITVVGSKVGDITYNATPIENSDCYHQISSKMQYGPMYRSVAGIKFTSRMMNGYNIGLLFNNTPSGLTEVVAANYIVSLEVIYSEPDAAYKAILTTDIGSVFILLDSDVTETKPCTVNVTMFG